MPDALQFPRTARRLARRRITNGTSIRSIKPPSAGTVDYFDDLTPGLSLRVTSNDVRSWTVFYRDKNGWQKRTLGRYPAVKLVDARELAREAQRSVAKGGDPVVEKRAARDVLTFGELAEQYIDVPHSQCEREPSRSRSIPLTKSATAVPAESHK